MTTNFRKAQFARNMARNKFKRFENKFWEENRRHRNQVVSIRKQSLTNYFATTHCEKHDKRFWSTVSPFVSDKKFQNGSSIILEDNDETISDASRVSEIFNDFSVSVASEIGFEEDITSTKDPSVDKIKSYYKDDIKTFDFHAVDAGTVISMIKNINPRKNQLGMILFRGN